MKSTFDLKSMLFGTVVAAAFVVGLGANARDANEVGRFQVSASANHALVIDTRTGKVWEKYLMSSSGVTDKDFKSSKLDEQP